MVHLSVCVSGASVAVRHPVVVSSRGEAVVLIRDGVVVGFKSKSRLVGGVKCDFNRGVLGAYFSAMDHNDVRNYGIAVTTLPLNVILTHDYGKSC